MADRGFTWDEAKARANAKTHGVSFDEAQWAFSCERAQITDAHRQVPHITTLMSPLFKKLNLTTQDVVHVLNAPASFELELAALQGVSIQRTVSGRSSFAIAFAVTQAQRDAASTTLARACEGDAVLWMAYPKGTSRNYTCEFNRDSGWSVLGAAGFEPVRQVAIDEDWSALRFRRVEHIKTMTRNPDGAISVAGAGKARAARRGDR